ncbi:hypothetical protein D3C81_2246700 [compost metagenome]
MAPGTRVPSWKMMVGVPVILCLRPSARLRWMAAVSQLADGVTLSRSMWSSHSLARSFEHQMLRLFSAESGLRIG